MKLSEIIAAREKAKEKVSQGQGDTPEASMSVGGKSAIKVVRTRETPNPNSLQFVLNAQILDHGNKSYAAKKDCAEDPLGKALFNVQGVGNVFVMENFVTVTKEESEGWNLLRDRVWKTIDKHARIYKVVDRRGLENIDVENFSSLSKEDQLKAVEMVLNRSIRSNLAKDGGGVEVKGIEANVVSIQYHGACGSCSTSTTGTLKYIQNQLKQQLHPNIEVQSI